MCNPQTPEQHVLSRNFSWVDSPPAYTPAQQAVIDVLGANPSERPEFDADLRGRLHDSLAEDLAPFTEHLTRDDPLFVSKRALSQVHGCEELFLHEQTTDFEWIGPIAVGMVAHKAIELSIHWRGSPHPFDLVDEAMGRLSGEERGLGLFLSQMPEGERAQLRSDVNDRVAAFLETWPKLKPRWRPVTESRVRAEFLGSRIVLSGKVDLTLGNAEGMRAGKVIIDLKTGRFRPAHRDDLRYYALIETLRVGTPPRLIASYYLDQGQFVPETVTEDVLDVAAERLVRGVQAMTELADVERDPVKRPSLACNWCPLLPECEEGSQHIAQVEDEG